MAMNKITCAMWLSLQLALLLSTTAVGFRIIYRAINGSSLFLADWLIILALANLRKQTFEYGISIVGVVCTLRSFTPKPAMT
ncbi:hypothetical protein N7537_003916 [Penicillium hordei]|uniref:Uncharacterized protein n=1 Tax=Penicillium hordei TaxID=40994 RepID=A0AAD6EBL6_9EURO|nr:uncharacterized protein N7537_003916 [Penicillium hordei]KAJ5607297.1 hypothetical protein N7537_003916 [Penicillium hordei]